MSGDRTQCACVIALAREILYALIVHAQLDDAILASLLQDIDAWGAVRAELLLEHHGSQRAQLREIVGPYRGLHERPSGARDMRLDSGSPS
jgi:hypothetical protein